MSTLEATVLQVRPRFGRHWTRLLRDPSFLTGALITGLILFVAIAPGLLTSEDPLRVDGTRRLAPPGPAHPFGTDELGRDMFSRVLHGTRLSVSSGLFAVLLATGLGGALGALAGYVGGTADEVIMRLADIFLAFPALVMAMALVAVMGPSLMHALLALAIVWWPQYARLVRILVVAAKEQVYVEAARATGVPEARIMLGHVAPNIVSPLIIKITLDIGTAILLAAALSFLGLGAQPPTPEWGSMITTGRNFMLEHWWYPTFPGGAIFLTVLGFNLLGDGLRDFLDPKLSV
ncbi:MAG: ABC transporter permease [Armatimonadota bacterium]|nr:ABC transporter permease [Armatimonadota bacterium]MDR7484704.1 ABC transporter permease [Armatimonadota bacterium]MDR7531819.1 ABC transporter permease [Armatimonadota bacterium]MDR7534836.1 ABC transporter permease [Armatimonadota bacterium]